MVSSHRENEIKLAFDSPEMAVTRLVTAGAVVVHPRSFEDNTLFDLADRSLTTSGRILRLRSFGGASVLTFKAPVAGEHRHKVKIERELPVSDADALRAILLGVGFVPVYRYQKYRATYRLMGVEVAVDETPIGVFVELEGTESDVDRAAAALGASPSDYIRATYRDLQEKDAVSRGIAAGDMLI